MNASTQSTGPHDLQEYEKIITRYKKIIDVERVVTGIFVGFFPLVVSVLYAESSIDS